MNVRSLLLVASAAIGLSACNGRTEPVASAVAAPPAALAAMAPAAAPASGPTLSGPVLGPDGRCNGEAQAAAASIAPGIGECDLVRLKGKPPTDVLIGESGKGQREVQVLYSEPGARELYLFVDNRLDRIVK